MIKLNWYITSVFLDSFNVSQIGLSTPVAMTINDAFGLYLNFVGLRCKKISVSVSVSV